MNARMNCGDIVLLNFEVTKSRGLNPFENTQRVEPSLDKDNALRY